MTALRKITVHLPHDLIEGAQAATGAGLTETVKQGLEKLRREAFYRQMKALRGTVDFGDLSLDDLREDKDHSWDPPG
ncbi:hypothetical protein [Brevundimonas sp. R86498]|uniref:hypothetical protein n=1 Tax=Brevundimonas sp. R86498 TaxID=3093845 RepID=UPI0037C76B49